jgi:hypothetical protein
VYMGDYVDRPGCQSFMMPPGTVTFKEDAPL